MTIVYKEEGTINKIKNILDEENPSSVLLIRGNKSYEISGAKDAIEHQLSGYNVTCLSGFRMYTSLEDIKKAINLINESKIDFVIAIGGGSVMDVGKTASILHREQNPLEYYITGKQEPQGRNIKLLLIPTTAGTGAEITPFSAIYIGKTKYSLGHSSMSPDYAILAPELTYSLSPVITAQTGCDALAQAIESFWSVNATEESKEYSREAIKLILSNLPKAVDNPDPQSRRVMLMGAHLAGKSIAIAKTTAAHALSYPLTVYHNIPHGHAVMLTLPYFFSINEKATANNIQGGLSLDYVKKTFIELLSLIEVKNGEEARDKLLALMDEIHLERKLSALGIQKKDLQSIIDNGFNPQRVKNNPVKITEEIVWKILKNIF